MPIAVKVAIALAAILAAVWLVFLRGGDVSGAEARRLVQEGALLVDVRSPEEFEAGHIPGAVNMPVGEIDRHLPELGRLDRPIVVYCRSGFRSARAARQLASAGYSAVHDLGGMSRW